jgi:hypothetical protein
MKYTHLLSLCTALALVSFSEAHAAGGAPAQPSGGESCTATCHSNNVKIDVCSNTVGNCSTVQADQGDRTCQIDGQMPDATGGGHHTITPAEIAAHRYAVCEAFKKVKAKLDKLGCKPTIRMVPAGTGLSDWTLPWPCDEPKPTKSGMLSDPLDNFPNGKGNLGFDFN